MPTVTSGAATRPARAPASTRWHEDRQSMAFMSFTASVTDMSPMPPTGENTDGTAAVVLLPETTAAHVMKSASVDVDALSSDGINSKPEDGTSQDVYGDIVGVGAK